MRQSITDRAFASNVPILEYAHPTVESKTRNLPGISRALALCRQSGEWPEVLAQVASVAHLPLPVGLRKWPTAAAETLTLAELLCRPPESVEVLVSEQVLFAGGAEAQRRPPDCVAIDASPNVGNLASIKIQESVGGVRIGENIHEFPESLRGYTIPVHHYIYRVSRESWLISREQVAQFNREQPSS